MYGIRKKSMLVRYSYDYIFLFFLSCCSALHQCGKLLTYQSLLSFASSSEFYTRKTLISSDNKHLKIA